MVRIAHFSDTHLGYKAYGRTEPESGRNQRTMDVEEAFTRVIDSILDQQPDMVLHSGDVFHHSRPSWRAMSHFVKQMRRIEQAGLPTLVIAGNHDTPRLRTDGSAYNLIELALPDITFVTDYEMISDVTTFSDLNVRVQALPHGALTNDTDNFTSVVRGKRNILVSHGVVPGVMPDSSHGEPGEQTLASDVLDPEFDYIALGHYHLYTAATARAWYAGSTERFGFGDRDATPGYALVELGEPGAQPVVQHVPIETRPMLSLPPVYAGLKPAREIADSILHDLQKLESPEAMVSLVLRDIERPTRREVERIIRREGQDIVWYVHFISERQMITPESSAAETPASADLRSLFAEFIQEKTGNPLTREFATRFFEVGDNALERAMAELPESEGEAS